MASFVAAVRVLSRAAAIQAEEAARVAGTVAVSRSLEARDARERQVREAEAPFEFDAVEVEVEVQEAIHEPAPWPTSVPPVAETTARPPLPLHTPPPPPVPQAVPAPELRPPTVKIAKVVKVVAKPLELEQRAAVPEVEAAVPSSSEVVVDQAQLSREPEPAVDKEALIAKAQEDNLLAKAEDAAAKLPAIDTDPDDAPVMLRASTVPSSRLGRLFHYGCESYEDVVGGS